VAIQRDLPDAREAAEKYGDVATTAISAFEMVLGAYATRRNENILSTLEMLENITILQLDLEASVDAGRIGGTLRNKGEGLDARDVLIAGIVKSHGETLITRNTGHFSRVDGLKTKMW
jgi:predicted nucleic acid-binding protein